MDGVVKKTRVTSKQRKRNLEDYGYDFVRNPPGHINEKGQLVVKHPGARNAWSCSQCQEQLATNKLFEKHLNEKHQVRSLCIYVHVGMVMSPLSQQGFIFVIVTVLSLKKI